MTFFPPPDYKRTDLWLPFFFFPPLLFFMREPSFSFWERCTPPLLPPPSLSPPFPQLYDEGRPKSSCFFLLFRRGVIRILGTPLLFPSSSFLFFEKSTERLLFLSLFFRGLIVERRVLSLPPFFFFPFISEPRGYRPFLFFFSPFSFSEDTSGSDAGSLSPFFFSLWGKGG